MTYAKGTDVPVDRSQAEIRKILAKYGARNFAYAEQAGLTERHPHRALIIFEHSERRVRFSLPLPPREDFSTEKQHAQALRSRWRALVLAIKAKLECVESGIATFEEEFLAYIVLPNQQTMGQLALPQIATAYSGGKMPPLLGYTEPKV